VQINHNHFADHRRRRWNRSQRGYNANVNADRTENGQEVRPSSATLGEVVKSPSLISPAGLLSGIVTFMGQDPLAHNTTADFSIIPETAGSAFPLPVQ
jgi:hypothetical protein